MKTILHVAQDAIRANKKDGGNRPTIIVRNYKGAKRYHYVSIAGPSYIYSDMKNPLQCGARVWLETESPVDGV